MNAPRKTEQAIAFVIDSIRRCAWSLGGFIIAFGVTLWVKL